MSKIESRLEQLGFTLPKAAAPLASYVPFVIANGLAFISGQLPIGMDGPAFLGRLGAEVSLTQGKEAACLAALNLLAQLKSACGDLDHVQRCVRLGVFVSATEDFTQHSEVANGASDFIRDVFGDSGRHARAAVGVASLPRGVAVEVEGIFQLSGG